METVDNIANIVAKAIINEQESIALYETIERVGMKFEGKPITKAIATAVQKDLGAGYQVTYSTEYGLKQLVVVKGNDWQNRRTYQLGYATTLVFKIGKSSEQHSGFAYYANCYGDAAKARNAKRETFIRSASKLKALAKAIEDFKSARKQLQTLLEDLDDKYELRSVFGLDKE